MNKLMDKTVLVTGAGLPVEGGFTAAHVPGVNFE